MQAQLLKDGNLYQDEDFSVRYYNEEQFQKYKASAKILGSVYLKPEEVENEQERLIVQTTEGKVFQLKICPVNEKEQTFGYIYTGNLDFIKIAVQGTSKKEKPKKEKTPKQKAPKQKNSKLPVIIVIAVAVMTCIGIGVFLFLPKGNKEPDVNPDVIPEVTILPLSEESTEIPLYMSFDLKKNESLINLSNPVGNTVDFKYEIYNNGTLLFSTENIAPGSQTNMDMGKYLQEGEYDLIFKVRCFLNGEEVNGTEEPVRVVIS